MAQAVEEMPQQLTHKEMKNPPIEVGEATINGRKFIIASTEFSNIFADLLLLDPKTNTPIADQDEVHLNFSVLHKINDDKFNGRQRPVHASSTPTNLFDRMRGDRKKPQQIVETQTVLGEVEDNNFVKALANAFQRQWPQFANDEPAQHFGLILTVSHNTPGDKLEKLGITAEQLYNPNNPSGPTEKNLTQGNISITSKSLLDKIGLSLPMPLQTVK